MVTNFLLGDESWKEMIQEAVKDDKYLQQELVVQVSLFGDLSEALHWAQFYRIPKEEWPTTVRHLFENPDRVARLDPSASEPLRPQAWEAPTRTSTDIAELVAAYHKFSLPVSSIRVLDTPDSFKHFLDYGLRVTKRTQITAC